jgi:hypothetical protein
LRKLSGCPYNCEKTVLGRFVKDGTENRYKYDFIIATSSPFKKNCRGRVLICSNHSGLRSIFQFYNSLFTIRDNLRQSVVSKKHCSLFI